MGFIGDDPRTHGSCIAREGNRYYTFSGKYHLYDAYSAFGVNASGIALATNETLDPANPRYHWNDEGLVLKSTEVDDFDVERV
jgi:hypothetical protein